MTVYSAILEKRKKILVRIVASMIPMIVIFSVLTQTVFAKNVYVINDGENQRIYSTYASNPEQVLTEAGVELSADDLYSTEAGDGISEITVQRAQQITVNYCGKELEVCSYGETVRTLFDRLGIQYSGEYRISEDLTARTFDGMELTVEHVARNLEVYTEEIPYESIIIYEDSLEEGQRIVYAAGSFGQVRKTANVLYVNSQERERTVLEEEVLTQPVDEIVVEGTGKAVDSRPADAPLIGNGAIIMPDGQIYRYDKTDEFLATAYTHTDDGCDMITATGTVVHTGVVAVDPEVIPYGTRMFIVSNDGKFVYGLSAAEDCGGGIIGKRLDLYFDTTEQCYAFGARDCTVYFLK